MSRAEPETRRPWLTRAALAARDRLRARPLVIRRRLIYSFDLRDPVPDVKSALPLRFEIGPDPADSSGSADPSGRFDLLFRSIAGDDEVYRMRIGVRREELLHLLIGCAVPPRPMFLYDCLTHDAFRGRGVYPASLAHALRFGRERGYDGAFIRVERSNVPSVIGIERAGFKPAAIILHAALFGASIGPFGRAATWAATSAPGARRHSG
jgi:GNAT superfamily N-acetyltransferase